MTPTLKLNNDVEIPETHAPRHPRCELPHVRARLDSEGANDSIASRVHLKPVTRDAPYVALNELPKPGFRLPSTSTIEISTGADKITFERQADRHILRAQDRLSALQVGLLDDVTADTLETTPADQSAQPDTPCLVKATLCAAARMRSWSRTTESDRWFSAVAPRGDEVGLCAGRT